MARYKYCLLIRIRIGARHIHDLRCQSCTNKLGILQSNSLMILTHAIDFIDIKVIFNASSAFLIVGTVLIPTIRL